MELQDFLKSSFDNLKQSIEEEYLKKLQEHRDNISINTNPVEYSENYGRLDEIEISHSQRKCNTSTYFSSYYEDTINKINVNKNKIFNIDKELYIINNFIIKIFTYRSECGHTDNIQEPSINLIIDNCGNIYRYDNYSNNNGNGSYKLNESFYLLNKENKSKQPLCNFLIDKVKNIFLKKDKNSYNKTYNQFIKIYPSYYNNNSSVSIDDIYNMFNMIRDINKYIYEKFVLSIDNFKLNESLKELTEEKAKLESELFVNSKSNEKLNVELESVMNDNHKLSSSLKESSIENEKLKRQLEERNNLIIELSIANRNNSNAIAHRNNIFSNAMRIRNNSIRIRNNSSAIANRNRNNSNPPPYSN